MVRDGWDGSLRRPEPRRRGTLPDCTLIERYRRNAAPGGLTQGIRIDIRNGIATFRVGIARDEYGNATIEVTVGAARALNLLCNGDPLRFARAEAVRAGGDEGGRRPVADRTSAGRNT